MIRVEQMMGLLSQGRTQKLPVQRLHVGVFVGEADGCVGIQLPQARTSLGGQLLALVDGLTAAARRSRRGRP